MMMRMDEREEVKEKTSEFSSGCQSGWTMYLDQSNVNNNPPFFKKAVSNEEEDEEEEDLSMVSDASSGPPQCQQYCYCTNGCFCSLSSHFPSASFTDQNGGGGKKKKKRSWIEPADCSLLDDTASSLLFFSFSKTNSNAITTNKEKKKKLTNEDLSCGFSATTHFEGKPAMEIHHLDHHNRLLLQKHTQWYVGDRQGERKL